MTILNTKQTFIVLVLPYITADDVTNAAGNVSKWTFLACREGLQGQRRREKELRT